MFRELSPEEEKGFRNWARIEWEEQGSVEPNPIWHPIINDEITKMKEEQDANTNS